MKCKVCGAELADGEKVCPGCNNPVEESISDKMQGLVNAVQNIAAQSDGMETSSRVQSDDGDTSSEPVQAVSEPAAVSSEPAAMPLETAGEPKKPKKTGLIVGVAAAAVVAVGAFAFTRMSQKDPKEVVITALENIYTDDQVKPMEELFGISQFAENAKTADLESSVTVILDDCSEPSVKEFAGSGIRVVGKDDKTNKRSFANFGVIYKDMDLANLDLYYGDETLMMAIPELSSKVFTMNLGEGLEQRIKESPILGPVLESSEIDVEGLFDYIEETKEQVEAGGMAAFDVDALWTRYKEGTQAQEKFKEALVVEKGEKGTFTIDGQEVTCDGYDVLVSKESMMEFLRTTTDFFLNDEELKDQYLKQLEQSVKLTEIMGGGSAGVSVNDMYLDSMEDLTETVDQMIEFLDKSLTDVNMTVHVDKKGRLASAKGTTVLNVEENGATNTLQIGFDFQLQGGSYLTQNMTADIDMEADGEHLILSMVKKGTYDGKQLTNDADFKLALDGSEKIDAGVTFTSTYQSDGGDYHVGLAVTGDNSLFMDISMSGAVDQLEKGTSFHMNIDDLKITVMDAAVSMNLSGEYGYGPLQETVTALEGEPFDVLAADENQWQSLFMEFYMGAMQLMSQLSM
ncbi:MAG: zinc ribbon domain-containing protein [Hungatella sp.]|nr:zinc ribbon domain-containing protein [Hungatella sp.]